MYPSPLLLCHPVLSIILFRNSFALLLSIAKKESIKLIVITFTLHFFDRLETNAIFKNFNKRDIINFSKRILCKEYLGRNVRTHQGLVGTEILSL